MHGGKTVQNNGNVLFSSLKMRRKVPHRWSTPLLGLLALVATASTVRAIEQKGEDPGPEGSGPFVTGAIDGASKVLGHSGFFIARSPQRWAQIREALAGLGWKSPADDAKAVRGYSEPPFDERLSKVDFANDIVVGAFVCYANFPFRCHWVHSDAKETEVRFLLSCPTPAVRETVLWVFGFAVVPKAERIKAVVGHFSPDGTIEKAGALSTETFDSTRGDVVDGLSAAITCNEHKIKAGADILMGFHILLQPLAPYRTGYGVEIRRDSAFVWDAKHAEQNHIYCVVKPDSSSQMLRNPERKLGDSTPFLVEVTAQKPYDIQTPEGKGLQSLKELGLITDKPGVYRITGVYTENGGTGKLADGKTVEVWGGNIASATLEMEVEP